MHGFWLGLLMVLGISSHFHFWQRPTQHQLMQEFCNWVTLLFFFQSKQSHSNSINTCDSTHTTTLLLLCVNLGGQETRGQAAKPRPRCLAKRGTWAAEATCPPVTDGSWQLSPLAEPAPEQVYSQAFLNFLVQRQKANTARRIRVCSQRFLTSNKLISRCLDKREKISSGS